MTTQSNEKDSFGFTYRDREAILAIFKRYPQIRQVVLFGSRAKGNFKKGSDIDLAIMDTNIDKKLIVRLLTDFEESLLPYHIDLVHYPALENEKLKEYIDKIGVAIYQATS
jgi:uncharacterized protein